MFVKRAFLLAVLLVGAFAQDTRDLAVSKANEKGPIKVVKNEDDVYALASRWAASLKAGWDTEDGELDTSFILGEYAPDGAVTLLTSKGGFDTGSQLLPTVSNIPATTNDLRKAYFEKFLLNEPVRTEDDIVCLCECRSISPISSLFPSWRTDPYTGQLDPQGPPDQQGRGHLGWQLGIHLCR
jgi:hypothetical protein